MSFNFGAPAAPTGGVGGGFTFGAAPVANSPLGGLKFGTPAPMTSFGAAPLTQPQVPAVSSAGLGFGNTQLNFGTPAVSAAATTAPPTLFGALPASTLAVSAAPPTLNFSAGTAPSFGLTSSLGQTTLNFNSPAKITTTAPLPTTLGTTFTLPSVAPNLSAGGSLFSAPIAAAAAPTTITTVAAAPPSSAAQPPTLTFNLGSATTTTTGTLQPAPTSNALSFKPVTTATATSSAAPTLVTGLGGIAQSTALKSAAQPENAASSAEVSVRDQPLPNEILQTVQAFRDHVKKQAAYSSDIAKLSIKEFKKVKEDIDDVNQELSGVEKQLQSNRLTAENLKIETARCLQHVEMAQRTNDIPPGLQHENIAPLHFFLELVDSFERDMQHIKLQIESTEQFMQTIESPIPLTSDDLSIGLRRLHDSFVALAGRLQSVHSQVEFQKEQYINYRRYMLNEDVTNIFEQPTASAGDSDALQIALKSFEMYDKHPTVAQPYLNSARPALVSGPTPFGPMRTAINNSIGNQNEQQTAHSPQQHQSSLLGGLSSGMTFNPTAPTLGSSLNTTGGLGLPPPYPGSAASSGFELLNNPTAGGFGTLGQSNNFQLQKPPTGSKRGKP